MIILLFNITEIHYFLLTYFDTLISLITVEVGINVEGVQNLPKSINVEVGINVEGGIFRKKLVHKCNKQGVKGGKNLKNQ